MIGSQKEHCRKKDFVEVAGDKVTTVLDRVGRRVLKVVTTEEATKEKPHANDVIGEAATNLDKFVDGVKLRLTRKY